MPGGHRPLPQRRRKWRRWCASAPGTSIPVAPRGQGHTQTGQSTTDGRHDRHLVGWPSCTASTARTLVADCGAGLVWRDLVAASLKEGLVPPVLTNNLGVTVAGTTSVAGLGVASFRYGTQADNAVELEVVTGEGDIVRCSARGEPRAFRRRALRPRPVRHHHPGQDPPAALQAEGAHVPPALRRAGRLDGRRHAHHAAGRPNGSIPWSRAARRCPIFMKRIGLGMKLREGAQLFAYWTYPMFLTVEYQRGRGAGRRGPAGRACTPTSTWGPTNTPWTSSATGWIRFSSCGTAAATGRWPIPGPKPCCPGARPRISSSSALDNLPPQSLGPAATSCSGPREAPPRACRCSAIRAATT